MKYIWSFFIVLAFSLQMQGQERFRFIGNNPDTIRFMPSSPTESKQAKIEVKNVSGDTLFLYWDSELVLCGEGWDYSICDNNQCYGPFVKSCPEDAPNIFAPGYSFKMLFDIYDNQKAGSAIYRFRVWIKGEKEATLDTFMLHVNNCVNATSDLKNTDRSIRLGANPVQDYLTLKCYPSWDGTQVDGRIYSLEGRLVHSFKRQVAGNKIQIFTGDLKAGVYYLHLYQGNAPYAKTLPFIKQ